MRRQLKLDDALEQADVLPDPQQPMVEDTSYGEGRLGKQHADDDDADLSAPRAGDASLCAEHIFMLMLAQARPAPPGASSRPCHSSSASSERRRPAQLQTATSGPSNAMAVCQAVDSVLTSASICPAIMCCLDAGHYSAVLAENA